MTVVAFGWCDERAASGRWEHLGTHSSNPLGEVEKPIARSGASASLPRIGRSPQRSKRSWRTGRSGHRCSAWGYKGVSSNCPSSSKSALRLKPCRSSVPKSGRLPIAITLTLTS
jgi:hypothetical protein